MIKCKDCKYSKSIKNESGRLRCLNEKFCYNTAPNDGLGYWDEESYSASFDVGPDFGCIHAERPDGLKECCDTCKDYRYDDRGDPKCLKEHFLINEAAESYIDGSKVKCDEFEVKP